MHDECWNRFVAMAERYKAMGVRFVVFDLPESNGGSFWIPFNTHGVSADELPIERFDTPALREWMSFNGYDGPLSEVRHFDTTDDLEEILAGYDYFNDQVRVSQLA